ncbi:uncharacterized protein K460DRAFT_355776 [Cucurbitaria berberidis CBS 394.84]|uniref:Extradiol ring-cleavage dioxygenase class III enzyme subunit B domain-containing protein n=1 Tax=Cucurbitaria berberidis CBS 394.84 TaxID=1168544 RepID=A0A9P4L8H7_9PLEO|nr:uncharacterized protein K460DRAFT_355776 [Cucurbitaria berberidis CBS 394.84]KAF1846050.1 hypothetical protein K460DRAFT_355776 [Cucurbitaria berberidis CBS 394.84]
MFPPENRLDIPIIEVSTLQGCDPDRQARLGEVFESLRQEGFLIVASGMAVHSFPSIHIMRETSTKEDKETTATKILAESGAFDTHLWETIEELYEFKRLYPTVEHFTPLLVADGAASKDALG